MRQYATDAVEVIWALAGDLTDGLASGTYILPRRNAPTWTQKPDGFGGVKRMFNPDLSGSMTILFDAESKEHQLLITLANLDFITRSLAGPLVIKDGNTKEVTYYSKAYIATIPDVPKGVSGSVIPWTFNFQAFAQQPLDLNGNVVGD